MSSNEPRKQIHVNSSSIVDLKAELFRRQEQFRLKKQALDFDKTSNASSSNEFIKDLGDQPLYNKNLHNVTRLPKKILDTTIQKNKSSTKHSEVKIKENTEKDLELKREEEKALEKSSEMLLKKTEIYNKLSTGSIKVDSDDDDILVDFESKSNQLHSKINEEEEEVELVEIVDEFGRTRMINKTEVLKTEKEETNLEYNQNDYQNDDSVQWNDNNDEHFNPPKTKFRKSIHYEDIREGEIRDHGVAFFNFSVDEETRSQQRDMLEQLRKETESKQSEKQRIKLKRKQMLKQRLAKIAARKGIPIVDESETSSESEPEIDKIRIEKAKLLSNDKTGVKGNKLREWDIGKEGLYSSKSDSLSNSSKKTKFFTQERYLEKRREERNMDFAPPIYDQPTRQPSSSKDRPKPYETNKRTRTEVSLPFNSPSTDVSAIVGDCLSQIRKKLSNNQE
ncbi:hypothetical protein RDWZM_006683 [Blomia tropicalis]|uniref:Uncharacterized protein n=1 Tax=Blomia tropicalis TaxID=40697 RepID=A0A9Q0RPJ7_BLOTA|nr:hypothetical protein RDWZM_006683 [Blomia tropicalis]